MALDRELHIAILSDFARTLAMPYDVDMALVDLTRRVDGVLDLNRSGVTLWIDGQLRFATAGTPAVEKVERSQEQYQDGPCLEAFRSGQPVLVTDLSKTTDKWPEYTKVAAEVGIRSVAGVPMQLGESRVGALNLYSQNPSAWPQEGISVAQILADIATACLVNASCYSQQRQLATQLQAALDLRVVIEQAMGITAQDRGISVDEPFVLMRHQARSTDQSIRSVSQRIVNGGVRL
jgi:GAF domain-containing protein